MIASRRSWFSLSESPAGVSEVKCVNTRPPPRTPKQKEENYKKSAVAIAPKKGSPKKCFPKQATTPTHPYLGLFGERKKVLLKQGYKNVRMLCKHVNKQIYVS